MKFSFQRIYFSICTYPTECAVGKEALLNEQPLYLFVEYMAEFTDRKNCQNYANLIRKYPKKWVQSRVLSVTVPPVER